jgi:copper chaperone CopZ
MNAEQLTYSVPGVSCEHCVIAITDQVRRIAGADTVEVDLEAKRVTVTGSGLDEAAVRHAIDEAGYEVES